MPYHEVKVGPCHVEWGGQDLGFTHGDVVIYMEGSAESANLLNLPENSSYNSTAAKAHVDVPFAETEISLLRKLMPQWNNDSQVDSAKIRDIGQFRLRQFAKEMTLTPVCMADQNYWDCANYIIRIPTAAPIPTIQTAFSFNNIRIWKFRFIAMTQSKGNKTLVCFGDCNSYE